jgi:zinc finger HIT domain-containing protein 1
MPLIEVLPLNTPHTRSQPGWAYVPDVSSSANLPPASQQPGNRKRAARADNPSSATAHNSITAKQQKAIEQRLKDLDKENYRDVHVPIPKREGGKEAKSSGKKMTSNVRRILGYSRGFAHYLADEEAAIAAGGGGFTGTWGQGLSSSSNSAAASSATGRDDKRKSIGETKGGTKGRGKRKSTAAVEEQEKVEEENQDVEMIDADAPAQQPSSATVDPTTTPAQQQPTQPHPPPPRYDPALDNEPLLKTLNLPRKPTERVMAALLAEPPLSYAAARAQPLEEGKIMPRRHFCSMCGYWGKVKCRRCGERTCGLMECWKGHEAAGCVTY